MTILEQYDRAWRHFDMIAKQRIASFNHYLIVLGVLLTASAAVKLGPMHIVILGLLGLANMAAPVLFFAIDKRICRLLCNLKDTLFMIEEDSEWPDIFKPFHRDKIEQEKPINKASTFSSVFWSIFSGHFLLGLALLIYAIWCPKAISTTEQFAQIKVQQSQLSNTPTTAELPAQSFQNNHYPLHFHNHSEE